MLDQRGLFGQREEAALWDSKSLGESSDELRNSHEGTNRYSDDGSERQLESLERERVGFGVAQGTCEHCEEDEVGLSLQVREGNVGDIVASLGNDEGRVERPELEAERVGSVDHFSVIRSSRAFVSKGVVYLGLSCRENVYLSLVCLQLCGPHEQYLRLEQCELFSICLGDIGSIYVENQTTLFVLR